MGSAPVRFRRSVPGLVAVDFGPRGGLISF
jgi:hypothetical protein